MAEETTSVVTKVRIDFDASQAKAGFKDTERATTQLSESEKKYQDLLKHRVEAIRTNSRLESDLQRMGYRQREQTGEEKYRGALRQRVESMMTQRRMDGDLRRMGLREREQTDEEKYQKRLQSTVAEHSQRKRLNEDLVRLGLRQSDADKAAEEEAAEAARRPGFGRYALIAGAKTWAAAHVATAGLNFAANAASAAGNSFATDAQKVDSILDMIPVFGELGKAARHLVQEFNGVADQIRQAQYKAQVSALDQAQDLRLHLAGAAAWQQERGYRNEAAAYRDANLPFLDPTQFNRDTLQGQRAYEAAQARLPGQTGLAMSRAGLAVSMVSKEDADNRLGGLKRDREVVDWRYGNAVYGYQEMRRKEDDTQVVDPVAREKAVLAIKESALEVANKEKEIQAAANAQKEAAVHLAESESAVRKANIGILQSEIGLFEQRRQRAVSDQERIGGLNPIDRQAGLRAALYIQRFGVGRATPDLISQAERFVPEFIQKERRTFGRGTAEYGEASKRGLIDNTDIRELDRLQARAQERIVRMQEEDMDLQATKMADAVKGAIRELVGSFTREMNAEKQKLKTGFTEAQGGAR